MTTSRVMQDSTIMRTMLGFLFGLALIPLVIALARPAADEIGDADFSRAPREAQWHLLHEVASSDRYDERVLVGTSIVLAGFNPLPGSATARFGLIGMRVGETIQIVEGLLNRPRPPRMIIIDWSALHDVPHDVLPNQDERLAYYSLDYLKFALLFRLGNRGEPERRANATWTNPNPSDEFREGNLDAQLAFFSLFARHSKLTQFADDLGGICKGTDTRFVIVRFPVFYKVEEKRIREELARAGEVDFRKALKGVPCNVGFVDLLAESLSGAVPRPPLLDDKSQWQNINHFRPSLGEILLDDPRLGGPGKLGRKETGQAR